MSTFTKMKTVSVAAIVALSATTLVAGSASATRPTVSNSIVVKDKARDVIYMADKKKSNFKVNHKMAKKAADLREISYHPAGGGDVLVQVKTAGRLPKNTDQGLVFGLEKRGGGDIAWFNIDLSRNANNLDFQVDSIDENCEIKEPFAKEGQNKATYGFTTTDRCLQYVLRDDAQVQSAAYSLVDIKRKGKRTLLYRDENFSKNV